jgi:polyisoprenoid-binding protein YceI
MISKLGRFCIALFFTSYSFILNANGLQFTLDPQHSYVSWEIEHLGFSTQTGKWFVNGTLTIDADKPENSKVTATIKIADLVTGIPELNKHLLGPEFFDEAKFPEASFVSNQVKVSTKSTAKVYGTLTLHGVSKPIVLDVVLKKIGKSPINDKETLGFSATTELKRSDFGIKTLLPPLGDEIKIKIGAEAVKVENENNADQKHK